MTVVDLYGHERGAGAFATGLLNAGRSPQTPVGVFARVTRPDSQAAVGTLDELPALVEQVDGGPAILIIGDVVAHSAPWRHRQSPATRFSISGGRRMTSPLQQKIKITGPSVVTANRTFDGVVIWRTADHGWSTDLADAAIVREAGSGARAARRSGRRRRRRGRRLYRAGQDRRRRRDPPGNLREQIRRDGVTIALPEHVLRLLCNVCLRRNRPHAGQRARRRIPRSGAPPAVAAN